MPYRAGAGSGLFGSYTTPPNRPMVDVGGAIDSLTQGASSLIRQAYERKKADADMELRRQQLGIEQARESREQQREDREASNSDREFGLKQEAERHRFIEAGGIPPSTQMQAVPAGRAAITPFQPSPISTAMGAMPGVQVTPSNAPASTGPDDKVNANIAPAAAPGSVPVNTIEQRTTPESYDPTKAGTYQRTIDAATIREAALSGREAARDQARAEQAAAHDARTAAMKESAQGSAAGLVRLRATLQKANGPISRAMSGNQMDKGRVAAAEDLIEKSGGSYDDAVAMLHNSAEGNLLRKEGVTEYHLSQAHTAWLNRNAAQAGKLMTGVFGVPSDSAVSVVKDTRKRLATPPTSNPGPAQAGVSPSPAPSAPSRAIVAPGAKPAPASTPTPTPTPTAKPAAAAAPSGGDFTDDEVAAALKAGKTTAADVSAYISTQRKKKKGGS